MTIKPMWIVTDMDMSALSNDKAEPREFKSRLSAERAAKKHLGTVADTEAWIWRLDCVAIKDCSAYVEEVK